MYHSIDWPKDDQKTIQTSLRHYRGIYLLSIDFNATVGKLMIPYLKLVLTVLFVVSFSALIRLHRELDIISVLMVTASSSACAALLVPTSLVMSSVYNISAQLSRNLSSKISSLENVTIAKKNCELEIASCRFVCCQVGNWYAMEAKAKLTLVHNIINGVVFCLVNMKK